MKTAAIYARVSSDKQKDDHTIASQTAALKAFAEDQGYDVPEAWVFEDEGYSGANLVRPGLERVRDLAADGQIQAVLVFSPDRLSRKYAYQVLLTEEFSRHGVETVFVKAPQSATPEDQLLLQFQGMIAEYERAQILERSRRGKRHRAKAGEVAVLSCAPYGYRYLKKTDDTPARFEVIAAEAAVVRMIFEHYTVAGLSIGAIARLLNEQGIPTRRQAPRWERSTVWGMLRNPAYKGTACFGKTQTAPRQRVTRPLRLTGRSRRGQTTGSERPRDEWIEIPIPPLVSEDTFTLAAEKFADNKRFAPRRTIEPSLVQGLVSCKKCGYALSRTSTRSSARNIHYYRCIGSDAWRRLGGPVCDNRPIRQDLLDRVVWPEVVRLLEDPTLINAELDRRLAAARAAEPTRRRQEQLERDLVRVTKSMERLVTAYQEDLLSLDDLRRRMPDLRRREQGVKAELQSIADQAADRTATLRLAETLSAFLTRLRSTAQTLDIQERQRIVRLLVRDVLVADDTIVIRHSIPIQTPPSGADEPPPPPEGRSPTTGDQNYLLRSGRQHRALPRSPITDRHRPVFEDARPQPFLDQADDALVADPVLDEANQPFLANRIEERPDVGVKDVVHPSAIDRRHQSVQRIVRPASGPEPVREPEEVFLVDGVEHHDGGALDDLVLQGCDRQRPLLAVRLRDICPAGRLRPIRSPMDPSMQIVEPGLKVCLVVLPRHAVHARRGFALECVERHPERVDVDVVEKRGEPLLLPLPCGLSYTVQRLGHAIPALRPERALLIRVPLGPRPSLHRLRRRSPGVVRRLRRYYGRV